MRRRWKLLLLGILALALLVLYEFKPITAKEILSWQPDNLYLAAMALLLAYGLKSMLVFVPLMLPQILIGHLYPREAAGSGGGHGRTLRHRTVTGQRKNRAVDGTLPEAGRHPQVSAGK